MYARSVTYLAQPGSIDEGIAFVQDEVMPSITDMDGCIGLSFICDRDSGTCIATSAWSSEEARDNSLQALQAMRDRGAEIFGSQPSMDLWEFAVLHRHAVSGEGACVRCTWLTTDAGELDHAIDTYRMAALPALEEMDGFCSASLMVDRDAGRAVSSATFASREAMMASRSSAESLRTRIAEEVGATVAEIKEFDLALAHLHVPEMV
ncbi:MAG: antibiotic biosynthesis monooxygenase [Actinomycetota bacterium]|nr:antibiotic biosynthesis monooxygenase [Actinomycetota bacterium]